MKSEISSLAWELSPDGGETWQVLFDGLYRHAGNEASKENQ